MCCPYGRRVLIASFFSQLRSVYNALPVLHKMVVEIKSIPHDAHAPHIYFRWLTGHDPLFIIAAALIGYVLVSFFRRHWRMLIVLVIFISFASLLSGKVVGYPRGGGDILTAANKLPLKDRPVCVFEALGNGVNWFPDLLSKVKICKPPKRKVVIVKQLNVDTGRDGYLDGTLDGPHFVAKVRAAAPNPSWQGVTQIDEQGNRAVYLEHSSLVYEVKACPDDGGQTPAKITADTSGVSFTNYIYKYADPSAYDALLKGAASLQKTSKPGIYVLLGASGTKIGYLVPAAGERGQCAVVSGPYIKTGNKFTVVAKPSESQVSLLDLFGQRTLVNKLQIVHG